MAGTRTTLTITDGKAKNVKLPIGTYSVKSIRIPGYTDAAAQGFTVTKDTTTATILLTASGVLTVNVVDEAGNPITSGFLQFSNADASASYGAPVKIEDGVAVFSHVPYDGVNPVELWVNQLATDDDHERITTPQKVEMAALAKEITIVNPRKAQIITVKVKDSVYPGITEINGEIVVKG